MRIYYFGTLVADSNESVQAQRLSRPPVLIRDILPRAPEPPRAQTSEIESQFERSMIVRKPAFVIRNYAHA